MCSLSRAVCCRWVFIFEFLIGVGPLIVYLDGGAWMNLHSQTFAVCNSSLDLVNTIPLF